MRVLSRDPGQAPGYAVLDGAGAVLNVSHTWQPWMAAETWDLAVTEAQWWDPHGDKDPNRLFTLSFDAGWSLARIPAHRYMLLKPQVWRNTNLRKEQVQNGIAKQLTTAERKLFAQVPASRHGDVLDAIGIGRGALANLDCTTYDWPKKGYGK